MLAKVAQKDASLLKTFKIMLEGLLSNQIWWKTFLLAAGSWSR